MNILIVDDQRFIRESIKNDFSSNMSKQPLFYEADGGNQAIEILEKIQDIDVIISDLKMEDGDGLTLFNYMNIKRVTSIPLLVLSSSDKRTLELIENIIKTFNLNLVGVFKKPLNINNALKALMKAKNKKDENRSATTKAKETLDLNKNNIDKILKNRNLFLHYQPQIDLKSKEIVGFEVLSRFFIKGYGFVYPDEFIPLIEERNLGVEFAKLILNQALSQWNINKELYRYSLSVNLSARDLNSIELIDYFISKKKENKDIKLNLEITESEDTVSKDETLKSIAKLIINGISVSLDDFGKSYSTFDRLDSIPFSEIKIDKDFVSDLDSNIQHLAIVESTIELAKKFKIKVVAEGVETKKVISILEEMGCDIVQGYYYSPPIEGRCVMDWINRYKMLLVAI